MFEALYAGLFNGLIYAAVAVGLALIWGITDVINFAHGEFLMLAMYAAYWFFTLGHVDPMLSAPLVAILLGFVGFLTYALIIKRLQKGPPMAVILATFAPDGPERCSGPTGRREPAWRAKTSRTCDSVGRSPASLAIIEKTS